MSSKTRVARGIIESYFKKCRLSFDNSRSKELKNGLIFFAAIFFTNAFSLYGKAITEADNMNLVASVSSLVLAIVLIYIWRRPSLTEVSITSPVPDQIVMEIIDSPHVHKRLKKQIAITIKRNKFITYQQVLDHETASDHFLDMAIHDASVTQKIVNSLDNKEFD